MSDSDKYPHAQIGERLKAIRLSKDLNVKEFVSLIDVNYTRYINWETGARRLMPEDAVKFCDLFEVDLDFIYRGKLDALSDKILKALSSMPRDSAHKTSKDNPDTSARSIS
ncbi:helix-turn-helix transcriptional regulator [Aliisedimentitalea scapharcae]|uniref:Helix-turn-helix transcriptional regulator n=1 Tax=Aliisedimentitalea scapharcae TaxID=1524259 RepID=A0ABZ2XSI4_9RHOB